MNKAELIKAVQAKMGDHAMTNTLTDEAIKAVFAVIGDSLVAGESVAIPQFGTFEVKKRAERVGRNPRTKENVTIPACKVASWKSSSVLKRSLNPEEK